MKRVIAIHVSLELLRLLVIAVEKRFGEHVQAHIENRSQFCAGYVVRVFYDSDEELISMVSFSEGFLARG